MIERGLNIFRHEWLLSNSDNPTLHFFPGDRLNWPVVRLLRADPDGDEGRGSMERFGSRFQACTGLERYGDIVNCLKCKAAQYLHS